VFFLFGAE